MTISEQSTNWPDGWYVYQEGRVDGPFSAQDAFSLAPCAADGKQRMVSRKGFSQWYAIRDLAEIYRITDYVTQVHNQEREKADEVISEHKSRAEAFAKSSLGDATAARVQKPTVPSFAASVRVSAEVGQKPKVMVKNPAPTSLEATPITTAKSPVEKKPAEEASSDVRPSLMHEYFLQREPLRLGKIRNPWLYSFLLFPLSLGVSWAVWYAQVTREVAIHRGGADRNQAWQGVLAMIPLVHIFMTWKLARSLRAMEKENKYQATSAWLAALFGIIPPFAMTYLQDAANEHWMIHVKYAYLQKQSSKEIR